MHLKDNKIQIQRIVWKNHFHLPEFSFHDLFVQAEEVKQRKRRHERLVYNRGQETLWRVYRDTIMRKR